MYSHTLIHTYTQSYAYHCTYGIQQITQKHVSMPTSTHTAIFLSTSTSLSHSQAPAMCCNWFSGHTVIGAIITIGLKRSWRRTIGPLIGVVWDTASSSIYKQRHHAFSWVVRQGRAFRTKPLLEHEVENTSIEMATLQVEARLCQHFPWAHYWLYWTCALCVLCVLWEFYLQNITLNMTLH